MEIKINLSDNWWEERLIKIKFDKNNFWNKLKKKNEIIQKIDMVIN